MGGGGEVDRYAGNGVVGDAWSADNDCSHPRIPCLSFCSCCT